MEDNICEEIAIKINWMRDISYDENGNCIFKSTDLPLNGKYERETGAIYYFKNGKMHNENGRPACIGKNGYSAYLINGKLHRIDGPAEIYPDGNYYWWINDYRINKKTMDVWLKENKIPLDWNIWSNEDKMLFVIHWCDYSK